MQVKNQLFEEITKEYSLQILKWAYKKCGDSDRAEELTQEVMVQIFSAIRKSGMTMEIGLIKLAGCRQQIFFHLASAFLFYMLPL